MEIITDITGEWDNPDLPKETFYFIKNGKCVDLRDFFLAQHTECETKDLPMVFELEHTVVGTIFTATKNGKVNIKVKVDNFDSIYAKLSSGEDVYINSTFN